MLSSILNIVELVVFIVPRLLQVFLGVPAQLRWIDDPLAASLYQSLSYALAGLLLLSGCWLATRTAVHRGHLVVSRQTAPALLLSGALVVLAVFTAAAPSTGLSLRYCAQAVASFVQFD